MYDDIIRLAQEQLKLEQDELEKESHTRLETRDITTLEAAASYWELQKHEFSVISGSKFQKIPLIFTPSFDGCCFLCCCCCPCNKVTIPLNFAALINTHGRYVGWMRENESQNMLPWTTISHLAYLGNIKYKWFIKEIKTKNNENDLVSVYGNLVFNLINDEKSLYNFCYKLGPR
eukprot:548729_1